MKKQLDTRTQTEDIVIESIIFLSCSNQNYVFFDLLTLLTDLLHSIR
jgi:hypothetical protein